MSDDVQARAVQHLIMTATEILVHVGVQREHAALVAESLVAADARGVHSHGLLRLPVYVEAIERGGISADPPMEWVRQTGAMALLDAGSGLGQVAMGLATTRAGELAAEFGIGSVAVRKSTHYGAGAYWTDTLAKRGLIALLVSTTGPSVAPFGSAEEFIGTNPLSISFPTGADPITADLATSAGAFGKIVQAAGEEVRIPPGWAIDKEGRATTSASAALEGSLLPFGGAKGSAIAVLIELLAGAATGGRFAHETVDIWADRSSKMATGALLVAIDPVNLQGSDEPLDRAARFREDLRNLQPASGFDAVRAPGDLEAESAASARGLIHLPRHVAAELDSLAARLQVSAM